MVISASARVRCEQILEEGLERYGMMVGIVSKIIDGQYEVVAVSTKTGVPEVGDIYELEGVYCREVYSSGLTVAITEYEGEEGMQLHPLYPIIPCEAYLSSPVKVNGDIWGTLNFTCFSTRNIPFSEAEREQNEIWAREIAAIVSDQLLATG